MNVQNFTLKGLRKLREVQANKIAEHIGLTLKTYYILERDPYRFRIEQAVKICEILRIDISDFLSLQREAIE